MLSQSLLKSGRYLLIEVVPEFKTFCARGRNPFLNQVVIFKWALIRKIYRLDMICRNPFLNQVVIFESYIYEVYKRVKKGRNPFLNQVVIFISVVILDMIQTAGSRNPFLNQVVIFAGFANGLIAIDASQVAIPS